MDPNQIPGQNQSPAPQNPAPAPFTPQPQGGGQFDSAQYDFITNPAKPAKKSLLPGRGSSKMQRIIIVVAVLFVLLLAAVILMNILNSGSKNSLTSVTKVLQAQTEISRVSTIGSTKANGDDAKAIAGKVDIVMMAHKNDLSTLATQRKLKIAAAQLSGGKNSATDTALTTAEKNGRFDEAFIQSMRTSLENYQSSLKTAYSSSDSKSMRELLDKQYKEAGLLLEDIIQIK